MIAAKTQLDMEEKKVMFEKWTKYIFGGFVVLPLIKMIQSEFI